MLLRLLLLLLLNCDLWVGRRDVFAARGRRAPPSRPDMRGRTGGRGVLLGRKGSPHVIVNVTHPELRSQAECVVQPHQLPVLSLQRLQLVMVVFACLLHLAENGLRGDCLQYKGAEASICQSG